jgi:hypothetical protein
VPPAEINPYGEVYETHTGVVVLVGDKAYKAKRPVASSWISVPSTAVSGLAPGRSFSTAGWHPRATSESGTGASRPEVVPSPPS